MRTRKEYPGSKVYAVNVMLSHYLKPKKDDDEKDSGSEHDSDKGEDGNSKEKKADWQESDDDEKETDKPIEWLEE